MLKELILIIIGAAGGVVGGMGMGGGTLLIPLLVLFGGVSQHAAQAVNLAAFIPMSAVALIIHFKNKLVDVKRALWIGIPAAAVGVLSSLLAAAAKPEKLGVYFGVFLLALGVYQLADCIVAKVKKIKAAKVNNVKNIQNGG